MSLFYDAQMGNFENIKQAVESGSDVNLLYKVGDIWASSLYIAAQNNYSEIVEFLINNGANINSALADGSTALYIACINGHAEVVEVLLRLKANTELSRAGYKPIDVAISKNDVKIAKYLVQAGAKIEYIQNFEKLLLAIEASSKEELFFNNLLLRAINSEYNDLVKTLVVLDKNLNFMSLNGISPLYSAIKSKNFEVTNLLLKHGADPDFSAFSGVTPLYLASEQGYTSLVALLLNHGANKDSNMIQAAAGNGHVNTALLLINGVTEFCYKLNNVETDIEFIGICAEDNVEL
jgi:uncharacterized protein